MITAPESIICSPERLSALQRTALLDTPSEPAFDRLTQLARRVLKAPIVLVTLVDHDRQFFKSAIGLSDQVAAQRQTPLTHSLCQWVVVYGEPVCIEDAARNPQFCTNLSVTELGIAAYLGVPIRDPEGHVLGAFAICDSSPRAWTAQDLSLVEDFAAMAMTEVSLRLTLIESRRQSEAAQAAERIAVEHEARYHAIIEHIDQVVFQLDGEGRWILLNSAWERITGYSVAETLGTGFLDRVHTDDVENNRKLFEPLLTHQLEWCRHEVRHQHKNGGYRWVELFARQTRLADGTTVGLSGTLRDITNRYEALEQLADSEHRFRTVVETLGEGLLISDLNDVIQYVNVQMATMAGYTPRQMIGRSVPELLYLPEDSEAVSERKARHARGLPEKYHMRYRKKDGQRFWVEVNATPFRNAEGSIIGTLCANSEITARKEAENRVTAMTNELRRSNAALQEFASVASHDLQEPLRKIQAFGDLLKKKYQGTLGDEGFDYLDRMQKAADRMQTLIHDLLLYSRVTSKAVPFKRVDLNKIAADVLSDLETLLQRTGGSVQVENLPVLDADPLQMRQLFQNLIGNALKFHKEGIAPHVIVSGEIAAHDKNLSALYPKLQGVLCRIKVQDNGIGFDPKYAERIFEVFERLNSRTKYEGTGIGLAVCRRIVERHGGHITASSVINEGTAFVFEIPRDAPTEDIGHAYDR